MPLRFSDLSNSDGARGASGPEVSVCAERFNEEDLGTKQRSTFRGLYAVNMLDAFNDKQASRWLDKRLWDCRRTRRLSGSELPGGAAQIACAVKLGSSWCWLPGSKILERSKHNLPMNSLCDRGSPLSFAYFHNSN